MQMHKKSMAGINCSKSEMGLKEAGMEGQTGILIIVAVCASLLLLGAIKKRAEWLMNFVLRGVMGTLAIYFINIWMTNAGMISSVGLNPTTVLTSAILGFPGVFALYGIHFFKSM